jgi:trigger factor
MKKRIVLVTAAIALGAATLLGGCGSRTSELSSITSATNETIGTRQILSILDYDPADQVKLPKDYMSMKIKLEDSYLVTDDQIREYAENMLMYSPSYEATDKTTVEDGDIVNLDYSGSIDGEPFDGGTAEDQYLTIGSGSFIEGFEEQLVGKEVGTEFDINVTFPEDYASDEVAGKDAVFHINLKNISQEKTITYDELTDDYVAENFTMYGVSTVDEFKNMISQQLQNENQTQQQQDVQTAVIDNLVADSEVTVPDGLVDKQIEQAKRGMEQQAQMYDMEVEEFMTTYYGMSLDEYIEQVRPDIEDSVVERLILQAIIKDQKIEVETADYNSFISDYSNYYGMDREEIIDIFGGQREMILSFAENKALEAVMSAADVTTKMPVPGSDNTDSSAPAEAETSATGE